MRIFVLLLVAFLLIDAAFLGNLGSLLGAVIWPVAMVTGASPGCVAGIQVPA